MCQHYYSPSAKIQAAHDNAMSGLALRLMSPGRLVGGAVPCRSVACPANGGAPVAKPANGVHPICRIRQICCRFPADRGTSHAPTTSRLDLLQLLLDHIHQHAADVRPERVVDLADAGRAGDVDFGQVLANYVQAYEQQAFFPQRRADFGGDPAIAVGQRACFPPASLRQMFPFIGMV